MKRFLTFIVLLSLIGTVYYYKEELNTFYLTHFSTTNKNVKLSYKNEYYKNTNYNYVNLTEDFMIKEKEQLIDVYYTIINSGIDSFTFYCSNTYKDCMNDIVETANNQTILSNINSFVHPYNSFSSIKTEYDSLGKITLTVEKSYTKEQIQELDNKVNEIIKNKIKDETDKKEIIKIIHDHIINNSKYDVDKSDKNINKYASNIAYGPLIEGYGLCGGYTDSMAIFLNHYNIPNFKVVSENHIWNAVYLDNAWYHLDLTWDDPVVSTGENVLEYNFFLISTEELDELNTNQHIFDKAVFSEFDRTKKG